MSGSPVAMALSFNTAFGYAILDKLEQRETVAVEHIIAVAWNLMQPLAVIPNDGKGNTRAAQDVFNSLRHVLSRSGPSSVPPAMREAYLHIVG